MIFMVVYLFCVIAALGLAALAAWSDFRGMKIPNYIVVVVMAAFVLCFGADYFAGTKIFGALQTHLLAGGITLIITFLMFSLKMIGGGDSKLVTAYSLWMGYKALSIFLFYMVSAGAVLGIIALFLKNKQLVKNPKPGGWIARIQAGDNVVPYGIPIAIGALAGFIKMGFLSPDKLALFLM